MIISNEFTVGAGIDEVWRQLLDMEGVATCLPGATITATDDPSTFDGTMKLKIGPMRVEYRGSATLGEVDEGTHTAVIALKAQEARGQGGAVATVRNALHEVEGGTRVEATTDLKITGSQAQFGRGVIEDVGRRVLGEFSQRLERRIAGEGEPGAAASASAGPGGEAQAAGAGTSSSPRARDDVLDVGGLIPRNVKIGAGVAALALAVLALRWLR
ncbi:MAG: SRPBCC family protein [Solirubrobacteraceae bacterium]